MLLLTRLLALLTVLMGVATMAVSAYAARGEGADVSALPDEARIAQPEEIDDSVTTALVLGLGEEEKAAGESPAASPPTPTTEIRYPVPSGAAPVTGPGGGRDNLSAGPQVWPVVSVKPVPVNVLRLAMGGLDIPPAQLAVMQQVSFLTGIPWQIFAAIAKVESNFGRNMATSSAGAIGYGQFLPEMWARYGNGGDPYDYRDAIPAMGRYLLDHGAPGDIRGAIYAYNHSWPYVALVLSYATAYGYHGLGSGDGMIWPVVGPISSRFGPDHPLGIDIDQTASPGAPVLAAHDGVVLFAGGDPCCSYGNYVILVSPSAIVTLYAHLDIMLVGNGDTVRQGQPLGTAGCTGNCTGTHLHFEVIEDGVRQNPLDYLP